MTTDEKKAKYVQLLHSMQAGVALEMQKDHKSTSPKHLRVGVNSAMVEHGALAGLLIKKGIITDDEYLDALIDAAEREVKQYEARLKDLYGAGPEVNLTLV